MMRLFLFKILINYASGLILNRIKALFSIFENPIMLKTIITLILINS